MPLIRDEPLDYQGWNGCMSRCRVRLFLPPNAAQESGYIVLLTDDETAQGTSITNACDELAAILCGRFHVPPERVEWIEHYDHRHTSTGHDGTGHAETFARVRFGSPVTAGERFGYIHGTSLGKPAWTHTDKQTVEILIGEPLP